MLCATAGWAETGKVELIRDHWGVPHVFAQREADAFFGLGYACAEDRLLQMELLRRRATGRLAEVFGAERVDSDRKFRIGGVARDCAGAFDNLPKEMQDYLRSYAAGVNTWAKSHPDRVRQRFAPLGVVPQPWTPSDCLAAWMAVAELFDSFVNESAINAYRDFQDLAAEIGETEALKRRTVVIDDAAAVVPESQMARDKEIYARLKATKRIPGFAPHAAEWEPLRFSHAWAVDGTRSTTGKPILESDPQTPVNNPAIWYEFHLCAGRYDVRGIGVAGCPAMLIGWNRHAAWGATALGAGCTVTFLDKLSDDGRDYQFRGKTLPFDRRFERIEVKNGQPVVQEVLTNRHGFVFNSLARQSRPGEAFVSYYKMAQDKASSVRAMLLWMRATNWTDFCAAMEHYYSPGLHVVYADVEGRLGYQTLAQMPLTRRTRHIALEGWTGENEVSDRIPLAEMPHMLNPDSHFITHANNLPVGSWYPHDLGVATGGVGDTARSMRLRQLLTGDRKFSIADFEAVIHRDNVNAAVAALLPVARKVVSEDKVTDPLVLKVLEALKDWDGHYDAANPAYPTATALAGVTLTAFRGSVLRDVVGGGEGGICHLARLVSERFAKDGATPKDAAAREYLVRWLRMAGGGAAERGRQQPAAAQPLRPAARQQAAARPVKEIHSMPYQANGPMRFPSLDPKLDLNSPPLTCGQGGTIWSQRGNSFTQIVDLADVDNSRSVLPPGISEDSESTHRTDQIALWVKGTTHPAPLSRTKVEALAASSMTLDAIPYDGPTSSGERLAQSSRETGARFIPAIPQATPTRAGIRPQPGELPGRKLDDAQLAAALRYLIGLERTPAEVDSKTAEVRDYIKGKDDLTRQMIGGLRLVLNSNYGTEEARQKMHAFLKELGGELPPQRQAGKMPAPPRSIFPETTWETRSPEQVGLSRAKLDALRDLAGGRGCVVRHGYMIYTWGDPSERGDVASACKPWFSHFLFKALEEGKIPGLDENVVRWEPRLKDLNRNLGYKDRNITWRHFANQTSCYGITEAPGTAFDYNDWQMALFFDTLFLKVYGATYETVDAKVLHPLLTDILQCEDNPTFMAFGLKGSLGRVGVSVRDFCRFGLLYLHNGNWNGRQVLSERLATMAVTSPLPNSIPRATGGAAEMIAGQRSLGSKKIPDNQCDHLGSYSWLWWTNGVDRDGKRHWPDVPTDTFGAFGHSGIRAMVVIPSLDLIVSWNDTTIKSRDKENEALKFLVESAAQASPARRDAP